MDLVRLNYSNCSEPDQVNHALQCMQIAHLCRHVQILHYVCLLASYWEILRAAHP